MKIDPRRGRVVVLTEPLGVVRALGSLLLLCSFVSVSRGLLMVRDHDHGSGLSSPPFWLAMALFIFILGLALSSPPRWRWVFDLDLNTVRSFTLRFNLPTGPGDTIALSSLTRADVVRDDAGFNIVEIVDDHDFRSPVYGVRSRRPGWPTIAAKQINAVICEHFEANRASATLNDPGVVLREAGIVVPIDPILAGPALEELRRSLSPDMRQLAEDIDTAYKITIALSNFFSGGAQDDIAPLEIRKLNRLQQALFFDLCVPALKTMHHSQYLAMAAILAKEDNRRLRDSVYSFSLVTRFNRYVAKYFVMSKVEPPAAIDLQGVIAECRMAIATVAALAPPADRQLNPPKTYDGREVVFVDPTASDRPSHFAVRAFQAGLAELSPSMNVDWTKPAPTADALYNALTRVERTAPIPMRNVLMRACARAATADDIMEPEVWLLLRGIADLLFVNVPDFVPEPITEARLDPVA